MPQDLTDCESNIGSGNGLVPSGTKPLSEPMLIKLNVIMASFGSSELILFHLEAVMYMEKQGRID